MIVVKPVTLVLKVFSIPGVRIAEYHGRVHTRWSLSTGSLIILTILILFLLFNRGPARDPVAMELCFVSSSEENLLCLILKLHLNTHLLEGPEDFAI